MAEEQALQDLEQIKTMQDKGPAFSLQPSEAVCNSKMLDVSHLESVRLHQRLLHVHVAWETVQVLPEVHGQELEGKEELVLVRDDLDQPVCHRLITFTTVMGR